MVQLSGIAKKVPTSLFGAFSKTISYIFIFIFIVIPILYAITLSVQDRNIKSGISYLAPKFLGPTKTLQEKSQQAIDNEGIYVRTEPIFRGMWGFIKDNIGILSALYISYLWISVLAGGWAWSPFSNTSNWFINHSIGLIVFFLIQVILLLAIAPIGARWDYSLMPFKAFYTFARATPYLIKPVAEISGNAITENITELINATV